jgi:hypothetical protein
MNHLFAEFSISLDSFGSIATSKAGFFGFILKKSNWLFVYNFNKTTRVTCLQRRMVGISSTAHTS